MTSRTNDLLERAEKHSQDIIKFGMADTALLVGELSQEIVRLTRILHRPLGKGPGRPRMEREDIERVYPGLLAKLGQESDTAVGEVYGLTRQRIAQIRGQFGVVAFTKSRRAQVEKLAGSTTDERVARLTGTTARYVWKVRHQIGVEAYTHRNGKTQSDVVREQKELLGTMSDNALSKQLGVHASTVSRIRNECGIAPCSTVGSRWYPLLPAKEVLSRMHAETDAQIARDYGVKPSAVSRVRIKHGWYRTSGGHGVCRKDV